jgi:hypothetical protein
MSDYSVFEDDRRTWKPYVVVFSVKVEALHEGLARYEAYAEIQRGNFTIESVEEIDVDTSKEGAD